MTTSTPIFRFATIRNATDKPKRRPELEIQLTTPLVSSLIKEIEAEKEQSEKITSINQKLEPFIQSKSFYKTKAEVEAALSAISQSREKATDAGKPPKELKEVGTLYENLYDNIVVRTVTKSTTNEIFKLLTDGIKLAHERLKGATDVNQQNLKIVLPERLVFSFEPPAQTAPPPRPRFNEEVAEVSAQLQDLNKQKEQLQKTKAETAAKIAVQQQELQKQQLEQLQQVDFEPATTTATTKSAERPAARTPAPETKIASSPKELAASPVLENLRVASERLNQDEKQIDLKLTALSHRAVDLIPRVKYARIGDRWVDITSIADLPPLIHGNTILVYSQGCYLRYPFQVADLRVVEQQTVGYLPAEIAHINNTQQGELHEKVTRRLKRLETFESLIEEAETFRETDSQSTEKFTLEKAASEVQSEETSISANASVSGTYGVVTASVDAGYSNSQSAQSANSTSQSYAREIVQRVVDRASNRVRRERNLRSFEEFEETVKHVIDNTKSTDPKSYVYRWLTKLVRAILKNYGRRLILQLDVAHPSHYYLSRAIKDQPTLSLPPDPRKLKKESEDAEIKAFYEETKFAFEFKLEDITHDNYTSWAHLYNAKLEQPPQQKIIVSHTVSGKGGAKSDPKLLPIPQGYRALLAVVNRFNIGSGGWGHITILVGRNHSIRWVLPQSPGAFLEVDLRDLNGEAEFLPITVVSAFGGDYGVNCEIECYLEDRARDAWRIKCYHAILEAYDNLKAEAENKMSDFDPNLPGLHPLKKKELIKTELKKGVLSKMFRCNPFWITDKYVVGEEYDPDCCKDSLNAEKVRFLETVFDWNNMTYQLHPYFYADHDNWGKLLDLSDDDPHFESFLQASYATVNIPVQRDSLKERAAVNFILNNSIANYEVVPAAMKSLLDELDDVEPTKFTTGLNGEDLLVPKEVVDLGIFPVPTDLVILECGVENGIKPIGFPQTDAEGTDVSPIPKQYSPAIIADRCDVATVGPQGDGPKGDGPKGDGPKGDGPKGDGPKGEGPKGTDPKESPVVLSPGPTTSTK